MIRLLSRSSTAGLLAGTLVLLPSTALAVDLGGSPGERLTVSTELCNAALAPAAGNGQIVVAAAANKASAILGGRVSSLEQITRQQAGLAPAAANAGLAQNRVEAGPGIASCNGLVLRAPALSGIAPGPGTTLDAGTDFLASKRLRINRTSFDAAWDRVQRQGLSQATVTELSRMSPGQSKLALVGAVNAWANARIRYVEDTVLYGKADYWAGAKTTLRRRAGDCEDIAIVKLQLLAALGVARSDMYLTVARDLARNADHAMLVVRLDGRNWLLDNATSEVLDASKSYDYRPIMSFSTSGKWLHGYSGA